MTADPVEDSVQPTAEAGGAVAGEPGAVAKRSAVAGEPGVAVVEGAAVAGAIGDTVRRLHAEAVAATGNGRPAEGAGLLRRGLALLGWRAAGSPSRRRGGSGTGGGAGAGGGAGTGGGAAGSDPALAARLLISLGYAEAEQGRTRYGFELLDAADALVAPEDRGVALQQRALMLLRTGRFADAVRYFDEAVPLLGAPEHTNVLCATLLNRSVLHLHGGRVRLGRDDLQRCEALARRAGHDVLAAKAMHNRGYCDLLAGDIPQALAAFGAAEPLYRRHNAGFLPVLTAARARALLTAGLAAEAARSLDEAVAQFAGARLSQELAEAQLLRAQAALDCGDRAGAAGWARRAERGFRRRGNDAWTRLAALTRLRAQLPDERAPASLANRATRLAGRLREVNLPQDAEMAGLLAARALVAAGRTGPAGELLDGMPRPRPSASLELVLTRRLARAELLRALGRPARALGEIRTGLDALQGRRSRLGSLDLQVGITALGRELAAAGLDLVFDAGPPAAIFDWSERSRAQAFRVPPVRPPADPEAAEALAELRGLRDTVRTAELERRRIPGARARCAELERVIQERTRRMAGPGQTVPVAGLPEVAVELAGTDKVMVSFLNRCGRLYALIVRDSAVRLAALGDHATVEEATARLLADLDALAGRRLPAALAAVIRGSIDHQLDTLGRELLAGMRAELGDHELVIIPTMGLSSLPWGLLPDLRGRPVTVSASASAWLRARRSVPSRLIRPEPVLLVAGPDLHRADEEIEEIAKVHPGSRALTGVEATVASTLAGLDGAPIAHLAAHGHHERDNVLFSRLDLADGPLMAYDIQRLNTPPAQVTLSACDVGRAVVRSGDEILGFTAALLYAGTSSVVSSVARVTHDAAASVMTGYHQAVAGGAQPARALADASLADPLAPFVCFGAG